MPEISQKLGFDASQAIQTLAQLDAAMQGVRTRFSSTAKAMGTFNAKATKTDGVLKRLKVSASGAATQLNRLNKAAPVAPSSSAAIAQTAANLDKVKSSAQNAASELEKTGKKGKKAGDSILISWQTLARVLATQAIVRALNAIRQALKATVKDAIDYQKAIAEIGTISGQQMGGLEGLGDVVTEISDKFNVALADTAEAAYQTVSNQVAKTNAELESFLGSAAKFAKVTKTDMTTAVNLLSGTLNAFGKEVAETEDIAAKFFKTIELGRTRSEELAQGLGVISPIADKLGVSLEELNAGIATLTIGGIKTDKAVTQLRGTMQGFLKPTTAMIAAMRELGFTTGEQVLEAYNLQDAVKAMITTTDGSSASIAKLFPRIRGLTGVMGLASDESEHFKRTLDEQKTSLEGTYDRAYKLVVSTDAEKVTKFFNEVKNFFVTEIGQRFLSGLAFTLRLDVERPKTALDTLREVNAEILKEANKLADKRLQLALDGIEKRRQAMAQEAAIARQGFFAAADAAEEANRIIVASTEWALDSMMGPIDAAVDGIKKAAAEGKELMRDFAKEADQSLASVQKTVFARTISVADDPNIKVSLLRRKSAEESLRAQELAAKATTKAELNAAKQLQASSRAYNDQAFSIAQSIKKKYENGKVTRDLTKHELELQKQQAGQVTQDLILRQDRYQKALEKGKQGVEANSKSLAESSREIVEYQAELDGLSKKLLELQKAAADTSLTPEDQKAQREAAGLAAENFAKKYQEGIEKFSLSADPLVKGLFEEIQKSSVDVELETIMQVPTNMQEIHGQIQTAFKQMFDADPLNVQVRLFAEGEGRTVDTSQKLSQETNKYFTSLADSKKDINSATKAQNEYTRSQQDAIDTLNTINAITKERQVEVPIPGGFGTTRIVDFEKDLSKGEITFNKILAQMKNLAVQGPKTAESVTALGDALDALPEGIINRKIGEGQTLFKAYQSLLASVKEIGSQAENTESAMSEAYSPRLIQSLSAQQEQIRKNTEAQAALNAKLQEKAQIDQQASPIEGANQEAAQLQATQTNVTSEVGNTNTGIDSMTTKFQAAETAAQSVVDAVTRISAASSATQGPVIQNPFVEQRAHGGRVGYFASGGHGQGTDTIPAMLSKDEHVTNARSSRRFFSQLQAMNAGQNPVFRSEGGDTYNTNVGDINVSGSGNPQVAAREVMKAIRREERRGSGR